MSDPSVADAGVPPKRGWYDDPTTPGRDRWWSGFEWTEHTARSPRTSMFGPGYERASRARPNLPAAIGQWSAIAALSLFLVVVIAAFALPDTDERRPLQILVVLESLAGLAAIVLGIVGLTRVRRWGGLWSSVYAIAIGTLALLIPVASTAIAIMTPIR